MAVFIVDFRGDCVEAEARNVLDCNVRRYLPVPT